jgi:ankyrin repeat domain-containing protein 50
MSGPPVHTKKRDIWRDRFGFGRSASPNRPRTPNAGASNTPPVHAPALPSSADPVAPVTPSTPSTSSSRVAPTDTATLSKAASASPSTTPARDLWFDALQTLSEDEQQAIQNIQPTRTTQRPLSGRIEELVSITRTKRDECEKKSYKFHFQGKEIILRDVAEKVILWLDKFKTVGDVVVTFDPVHASLPWAGVRFLLQVLISLSQ